MNIYLVNRLDKRIFFDEYENFLCVANSEEEAKRMHPDYTPGIPVAEKYFLPPTQTEFKVPCWVKNINFVRPCYIGTSDIFKEPKVINASYIPG